MADLTRQFKSTKEELDASRTLRVQRINELLTTNVGLEATKDELAKKKDEILKTKTEKIKKMRNEYDKLKKDFDKITEETNNKMQERI